MKLKIVVLGLAAQVALSGCSPSDGTQSMVPPLPRQIIDLGALVTEDLPERVWGKALLVDGGWYPRQNSFEVVQWEQELPGGTISGSNSYFTLWNHGGPHVDAPNHIGLEGGVDSYSIDAFVGPLKVFDVSSFQAGWSVGADFFRDHHIEPQDIVLIYTGYEPPQDDDSYPSVITITRDAAEYLASIPIRAFATDAQSVFSLDGAPEVNADSVLAQAAPVHESFLSRSIPIYEELFNVDRLLGLEQMYFVGVPLKIQDGDGMIVRPLVFVY